MKCVGIIGAMEQEVARLKEVMEDVSITTRANMDFYEGVLEGKKVVVVQSGIGKVNAGMCTQILADLFQVEAAYSRQKLDLNNDHSQLVLASLYLRMVPTQQIQSLLQDKHFPYIVDRHKVL